MGAPAKSITMPAEPAHATHDHVMKTKPMPCPCGTAPYAACCGPLHEQASIAPSAEALMRSRYSAYALNRVDYLLASWAAETRPDAASLTPDPALRWLGLTVLRAEESADRAEVVFVARFRIGGGSAQRMQERSRFVRRDGRWYYLDGVFAESERR